MYILYLCQKFSLQKNLKIFKTENIMSKTNIIGICHLIIDAIVWFIGIIFFIIIMLYKSREV